MKNEFQEIEIKKIKSLENIRTRIKISEVQELMQSIKQQGLLQPIGVWKTPNKEYVIAYGHRRLVSCDKLGWNTITAKMLGELDYEELLVMNTSENIHRKDITVAEFGRICNLLNDKGLSKGEIATRLSVPLVRVDTSLRVFHKIPAKHRKDIIFMKAGTKHKFGKISASSFNNLMSLQHELGLSSLLFDKLIQAIKKEDISLSQLKIIAILLREGATIEGAVRKLKDYNVRRITFPVNADVEEEMMEEAGIRGQARISELLRKILTGEIRGRKDFIFSAKDNKKKLPSW